jgi:hypothetical protein
MTIPHHVTPVINSDGSSMFLRDSDRQRQNAIAARIAAAWRVELMFMGDLSYIDALAVRDGRPIAWVELISRNYDSTHLLDRGGVYLKRATFDTLCAAAAVSLSVSWRGAFIVWDLLDGLFWRSVLHIRPIAAVARDPRHAANDTDEPVILVTSLHPLLARETR